MSFNYKPGTVKTSEERKKSIQGFTCFVCGFFIEHMRIRPFWQLTVAVILHLFFLLKLFYKCCMVGGCLYMSQPAFGIVLTQYIEHVTDLFHFEYRYRREGSIAE